MERSYLLAATDSEPARRFYDVVVIGSGIGGLTAAVGAARRWKVALISKSILRDTTTFLAQGGIAAALSEQDSPELHFQDTIRAGAGLCREEAVRILVSEGPARVRELMEICPKFDRSGGDLVLASEGAHSVPRIAHAGGDATGSEVASALAQAMRSGSRVQVLEREFVVDLLVENGRCVGAVSLNLASGEFTLNFASVVVLATGGSGQVYSLTTNPGVATGDGIAMAWRAGATIGDMEFVQFHPTGL
jgi:L-aspartate oxidase